MGRLLTRWPRLKEILDKDGDFLRPHSCVADAAALWRLKGCPPDFLLAEGIPLSEARDLITRRRDELEIEIVNYIKTSIEYRHRRRRRADRDP